MCGIGGILIPPASELHELGGALSRIQNALRHRGPDDSGEFISPSRRAGLVHARLSILDLSPAGHQPMISADGRFTIVFNGEIYNYRALRDTFAAGGVRFTSNSDTEVLLHLYAARGPDCVKELRGMFAFAIWDEREQTCFLARDPLGIKLLYFANRPDGFVFASELRAVLASGLVPRKLDPAGVAGFFQTGTVPEPGTLIEGVKCLGAGCSLVWKAGEVKQQQFWSVQFEAGNADVREAGKTVREALLDSVRHHFVSDVPVGVFLSGGIDSTAVLALSRAVGQSDLRTFSISFDDPKFNEGDLAARTAKEFGTRHADLRLSAVMGRELFQQFLPHLDQPSIDGFNTFTVSKFAHDQGMKVVLSGLGGDELFGGYPTFQKVPQMVRLASALGPVRPLATAILERNAKPQLRRLGNFFRHDVNLPAAYRAYRGVYTIDEARALAVMFCGGSADAVCMTWPAMRSQPTNEDCVAELELTAYMRNQLLRDSDVMSMAWGLELRVPFVDRVLVESLAKIPASVRLRAGKKLLLEAVPEVPEFIWNRPKRGFLFPFEQWLAGDWKEMFESSVRRSGTRAQTWYQKWSVFVLERWCETNGVPFAGQKR